MYKRQILGLVFSLALYGSAQWLVDNQIISDPRALIAIQLLSPAIFVVTILSCFRGYFQGFQYMVPTGTSQVFEQIFRVSSMVGLAYYFIAVSYTHLDVYKRQARSRHCMVERV